MEVKLDISCWNIVGLIGKIVLKRAHLRLWCVASWVDCVHRGPCACTPPPRTGTRCPAAIHWWPPRFSDRRPRLPWSAARWQVARRGGLVERSGRGIHERCRSVRGQLEASTQLSLPSSSALPLSPSEAHRALHIRTMFDCVAYSFFYDRQLMSVMLRGYMV